MNPRINKIKTAISQRNVKVDFLAILFGVGAWLGVNSIFLQLPLLVKSAPEGWSLPSYLVVFIQLGNIGPILYTLFQKYSPRKIRDSYIIYMVYAIGCLAAILMIFYHESTAEIAGQNRSIALYAFAFMFAIMGCTSSVLFMPYMGRFREIYLITYLTGEGFGGFLSGSVTLIQGVGGNPQCIQSNTTTVDGRPEFVKYSTPPRFDVTDFFVYVFSLMTLSAVAFFLLDKLQMCKKEYANVTIYYGHDYVYDEPSKLTEPSISGDGMIIESEKPKNVLKNLSPFNYYLLLTLMGLFCLLANGLLPSVQSYSCLPYGNTAYHLTVTLSSLANPLACFLAVFLNHTSIRNICFLAVAILITCCYCISMAILSPTPLFLGSDLGVFLVVLSWTLNSGLISYAKLSITAILRNMGGRSLVWVGAVTQFGSAIGAIVSFILVAQTMVFTSYEPC